MRSSWTGAFRRTVVAVPALALAAGLLAVGTSAQPSHWFDPATGLAVGGYDPVAYFTRRAPRRGRAQHELKWRGVVWRFLNSGNRAAFERDPGVYAPQFAGYDPASVAIGRPAQGHPAIWAVHKDRLYLFHDSANRRIWSEDPDGTIARANDKWSALGRSLPGNSAP